MKYAVETTSESKIGMDIIALKLSKKSYFTKQPTPVTDMKSKLKGDVNRKNEINDLGHGILNALSETLKICINPIKAFNAAEADFTNCFIFLSCCRFKIRAFELLCSINVRVAAFQ